MGAGCRSRRAREIGTVVVLSGRFLCGVRADDAVEKAFRAPSLGPIDFLNVLRELIRRRSEVVHDLRRLAQRGEAIGALDIAGKARAVLFSSTPEDADPSEGS